MRRALGLQLLLLSAAACSTTHVDFYPRENARAESPGGRPAAAYSLEDEGRRVAEVRVWSDGAEVVDDGRMLLHVGFEVENHEPVTLDPADVAVFQLRANGVTSEDELEVRDGERARFDGVLGSADFMFELPKTISSLDDLESFAVRWVARSTGESVFRQVTPFRRGFPPGYGYWNYGYWNYGYWNYGPWYGWYPYWGYCYW